MYCNYHESSYSQDGHRLLGYKILCGHVWAWEHCPHVRHVAKSDDNVVVDMDTLVTRYNAGFFWSILLEDLYIFSHRFS